MNLLVKDAARLLDVSENTIHRWIGQGSIPAYRLNEQYRFNRAELLSWAAAQGLSISPEIFREGESGDSGMALLSDALRAGGIHSGIRGADAATVLRRVVETMRLPETVDCEYLYEMFLAREGFGSTAIGDGIAIPHVRSPVILDLTQPAMMLCFLERPLDLGVPGSQPVNVLFTLISPTVRTHLHLLSRLIFVLRDAKFRPALARRDAPDNLLAAVERCEGGLGVAAAPAR
jgi:PTS system nitrogen regulatory IIA component